jgi:NAD(P)-dependent dehydrogenase (short-subunit alcohol dehydrogenase family)
MKNILITGAAKRIGREMALYMAERGWNVAVHYNHSEKDAEEVVSFIKGKNLNAVAIPADLSDISQVATIIKKANKALGEITCLVNNASIFQNDNIQNMQPQNLQNHMQVNLFAPLILAQGFAAQLKGQGNIINMLDYSVWNLPDTFLSYTLSKSSLWSATQMLAKQLAPNIRVNGIGPGHTLPNERENLKSFEAAKMKTPLRNGASPAEICRAIEFIIASPSFTGQMLAMDGGKHLVGAEFY